MAITPIEDISQPKFDARIYNRAALELYHQLNFLGDITASSSAIQDSLRPVENDTLNATFAQINNELISLADDVAQECSQSLDACHQTKNILDESVSAFNTIQQRLDHLVQSTENIENVVRTIETFARQTSMVAINAQIEAAQAGERGKGFAVVADEVGRLAQRIKTESSTISATVENISTSVQEVASLVSNEVERNAQQETSVKDMVTRNERLQKKGSQLPQVVTNLDQFLEPLERAREAIGHNKMIQVAVGNVSRNIKNIHDRITHATGSDIPTGTTVATLEAFIEDLVDILVEGREAPIESMIENLLAEGFKPLTCLDGVGKAVQAANMLQKHRHVSVGDYYFNFLIIERGMKCIANHLDISQSTEMSVVLGNARGDYHSLGREMVGLFLKSSGIKVIDVGLGAEVEDFVNAVKESQARVVGVSSLLIESAKEIQKIRDALDSQGLHHVKIVAGGACFVVDREFAFEVGADFVATAASDMVSIVQEVYQHEPM